jgi:hypothetical protein
VFFYINIENKKKVRVTKSKTKLQHPWSLIKEELYNKLSKMENIEFEAWIDYTNASFITQGGKFTAQNLAGEVQVEINGETGVIRCPNPDKDSDENVVATTQWVNNRFKQTIRDVNGVKPDENGSLKLNINDLSDDSDNVTLNNKRFSITRIKDK